MKYANRIFIGLAGLTGVLIGWGTFVEPRLIIDWKEEPVEVPNLPRSWEGRKVALIADLEVGMWLANIDTIRRTVSRLLEERPAAVLIAGDFIFRPRGDLDGQLELVKDLMRPLTQTGIPVYAVLGNHDYAMPTPSSSPDTRAAARVRDALESVAVLVLENEAVPVDPPGRSVGDAVTGRGESALYLVGIGAAWPDRDGPETAVSQVPSQAPRVVLMHNPHSFPALPAGTAPLAVAGHTHGGQLRIPLLRKSSWLRLVRKGRVPAAGWIEGYGEPGNRLYVNRGLGFSLIPIRVNCPPEVTVFTLRRAVG